MKLLARVRKVISAMTDKLMVSELDEGQYFKTRLRYIITDSSLPLSRDREIVGKKEGMKGVPLAYFKELGITMMLVCKVTPIPSTDNGN